MKKLINLIRGYVDVEVTGAFPERLLNLCAQNRLQFWKLCWLDETSFTFRIFLRDRKRLDELAQRSMCEVSEKSRRGATVVAEGIVRRRWGFVAGLAFCFLAVSFLSRFLLVIEVTGNETVSTTVILSQLQRVGVKPGAYGPSILEREAANEALLGLPELSYLAINIYGTRAEVIVHEAEKKPELLDEKTPADVVAKESGIIEHIHATTGQAMFQDRDIVAKGEVLITGDLDLKEPQYGTVDLGYLVVRAAGTVTARTWRTLEETIPLTSQRKAYTGEEHTGYSIKFLWMDLDFLQNSSISSGRYDKITKTEQLVLFDHPLPVWLTTTTLRGYELEEQALDQEGAAVQLEQALSLRLEELMAANQGEVIQSDFVTQEKDGCFSVILLAECREEIGRTVDREGEVGRIYGTALENTNDNG